MKLTLIADVHGNLPALEAVLGHARRQGAAQTILNLGDLTGYGPFPEEVVNWSRSPQVFSILGDYDKKVLSEKQRKAHWQSVENPDKRQMFAWTYRALSKHARRYLRALPEQATFNADGVKLSLFHGNPVGYQGYLGPDTPEEDLFTLAARTDAAVVLFGHTHQVFSQVVNEVLFVNPGTVGRSDDGDPRASYAILHIEEGQVAVQHFRVPYNLMASVHALRLAGLPEIFSQVVRRGLNYNDVAGIWEAGSVELEPCGTITLLTDFNLRDDYVGVMKGVIDRIAPQTKLIDISHQVRPQSITEGAHLLAEAVPYFSTGTVHIAVVDPGVGTGRRALAAQIGDHFYVAPDNGLLTLVLEKARAEGQRVKLVSLVNPEYWLPSISATFHGRDIFAPVGAHLANGLPLNNLGEEIVDPVLITLSQPRPTSTGWEAEVVKVDSFGNISTNLPRKNLPDDTDKLTVIIGEATIHGLTRTFSDAKPGALIATLGSSGMLAIAEVNGNAAQQLHVHIGTPVYIDVT